jgi:uncharacterized protein
MGQLLKIIVIGIGIAVLLLAIRRILSKRQQPEEQSPAIQPMVKCAYCGMYTPESQAISEGSQFFCNDAHRRIAFGKS